MKLSQITLLLLFTSCPHAQDTLPKQRLKLFEINARAGIDKECRADAVFFKVTQEPIRIFFSVFFNTGVRFYFRYFK